jgi:hypothetical protein
MSSPPPSLMSSPRAPICHAALDAGSTCLISCPPFPCPPQADHSRAPPHVIPVQTGIQGWDISLHLFLRSFPLFPCYSCPSSCHSRASGNPGVGHITPTSCPSLRLSEESETTPSGAS